MPERKQLWLLRHAKSSWEDPGLPDHDRPLAPRGRRAAKLIGAHLREHRPAPSLVLCSSALRATQTLELVAPEGEIRLEPRLYGASSAELIARIHEVPEHHRSVMLIGHNPGMQDLALLLVSGAGAPFAAKFPTAALAIMDFAGSWVALAPGSAALRAWVKPRELG